MGTLVLGLTLGIAGIAASIAGTAASIGSTAYTAEKQARQLEAKSAREEAIAQAQAAKEGGQVTSAQNLAEARKKAAESVGDVAGKSQTASLADIRSAAQERRGMINQQLASGMSHAAALSQAAKDTRVAGAIQGITQGIAGGVGIAGQFSGMPSGWQDVLSSNSQKNNMDFSNIPQTELPSLTLSPNIAKNLSLENNVDLSGVLTSGLFGYYK